MSASTPESTPGNPTRRKQQLLILGATLALLGAGGGGYWWLHGSHFVSTDNAYAATELATVTPAVAGTVLAVKVQDTDRVKQGDVLVQLDPRDAELALAQAEAEWQRALRRVRSYQANGASLQAQVKARQAEEQRAKAQWRGAEAELERSRIDLERRQALVNSGSVSADELTRAQTAHAQAQANAQAAQAQWAQAQAQQVAAQGAEQANAALLGEGPPEQNPEVLAARAKRDQAKLDLERTVIHAPLDGVVAKRQVQLGQRVAPGAPLLSVVPVQDIYVNANFKEGQLQQVKVGQNATLTADLYGTNVTYHGVVEGFSGGSGAAFAAIPAQNATGNWIKVVQRLPVRIKLDPAELEKHPLKVGLSLSVSIDTRSSGGQP